MSNIVFTLVVFHLLHYISFPKFKSAAIGQKIKIENVRSSRQIANEVLDARNVWILSVAFYCILVIIGLPIIRRTYGDR